MKLHRTTHGWCAQRDGKFYPLPGFELDEWLADADPLASLNARLRDVSPISASSGPSALLLHNQEVWAVGVTYLRSKSARMEESNFSATAYDKVYDAPRPELFFKADARRCVGDGGVLHLRDDSKWMVPEPELTLVIAANRKPVGFTIGDDLSCRDIEGENLLYLPQAKTWDGCCALGPSILVNDGTTDIRQSTISLSIRRSGRTVFEGSTPIARLKRSFEELIEYLFRNQTFPIGVFLLTGTGIVPPDDFTLHRGDEIRMSIPEIGMLTNTV
jgi:2-dehydro-3-deoxy-D-arabinonate dehydratase